MTSARYRLASCRRRRQSTASAGCGDPSRELDSSTWMIVTRARNALASAAACRIRHSDSGERSRQTSRWRGVALSKSRVGGSPGTRQRGEPARASLGSAARERGGPSDLAAASVRVSSPTARSPATRRASHLSHPELTGPPLGVRHGPPQHTQPTARLGRCRICAMRDAARRTLAASSKTVAAFDARRFPIDHEPRFTRQAVSRTPEFRFELDGHRHSRLSARRLHDGAQLETDQPHSLWAECLALWRTAPEPRDERPYAFALTAEPCIESGARNRYESSDAQSICGNPGRDRDDRGESPAENRAVQADSRSGRRRVR